MIAKPCRHRRMRHCPPWPILSGGSQAMGDGRLVVSGHMWSELPQIGRWRVQGRLVVGMGHTS